MKKIVLIVMIVAMAFSASACSLLEEIMASTTVVETDNFSIELPSTYMEVEDQDNSYYIDSKQMYVEYYYYPKEFDFDGSTLMNILVSYQFPAEDIVNVDETEIDGVDVYQVQYRTLTTGTDNIHYYYSGLYSVFELNNEFFVLDTYQYMEESVGINTYISDDDLMLMLDITNSVKIDEDSLEAVSTTETKYIDTLSVELTNNWGEAGDNNGYQDWGYFVEFSYGDYAFYADIYEYTDEYLAENPTDMETLVDTYAEYPEYEYYGETTIADEMAYAFTYGYEENTGAYVHGMFAESESYYADIYFYTVLEDYEMPDDVIEAFFDFMGTIK